MALVNGPAFSLEASGKLGGALVFSRWKGRPYIRQLVKPSNPKSAGQTGIRAMMKFLAQEWTNLSALEKASYDALAESLNISAFNAYVRVNMLLWRTFETPSQDSARAQSNTASLCTGSNYTGGVGKVDVSIALVSAANQWGVLVFRDTAEITTLSWDKVVAVVPVDGETSIPYVDSPLEPGTYHYRVAAFTDDGNIGTALADDTAVVT